MSSSKALRTVRPPNPESNTPMVGRRGERGPCSALIHLVPSELAARTHGFSQFGNRPFRAARPRRNRRPVRARLRMSQKRANLVGRFRRQNVFELAGLLLDLRFAVHRQTVGEKPLGQPVAPNNTARAFASAWRKFD